MEATQVNVSNGLEEGESLGLGDPFAEVPSSAGPTAASSLDSHAIVVVASSENKKQSDSGDQHFQAPPSAPGVSNCYVFKSQLQEYAQKVGLPTPVYETIKDGPSHEPSFKSAVVVGGARYESLPGFFNRKAAEQSAAEVALMDLSKNGDKKVSIAVPVHESGLCKNLLQEYAQKMNYAIPTYICHTDDSSGRTPFYYCTVEIGAIRYIGATARNKKEAEIKAARTALLAIQSSGTVADRNLDSKPQYTVLPGKRRIPETARETEKVKKPKKHRFKKPPRNRMQPSDSGHQSQAGNMDVLVSNDTLGTPAAIEQCDGLPVVQVPNPGQKPNCLASPDQDNQRNGEAFVVEGASDPQVGVVDSIQTQLTASNSQADDHGNTCLAESALPLPDSSRNHGVIDVIPMTTAPPSVQSDVEKSDQSVFIDTPGINALPANSGTGLEDPATAVEEENHFGGEDDVCTTVPSD